jgi:phosphoribosyl-ATP pyrophosphohydrolase
MSDILDRLAVTLEARKGVDADRSYVASLYARGTEAILKKVAEETAETIMAAMEGDRTKIVREIADLWFHTLVLLAHCGLRPADVLGELERREGRSGIAEKASRKQTGPQGVI